MGLILLACGCFLGQMLAVLLCSISLMSPPALRLHLQSVANLHQLPNSWQCQVPASFLVSAIAQFQIFSNFNGLSDTFLIFVWINFKMILKIHVFEKYFEPL